MHSIKSISYPIIPLRNMVIFPKMIVPLFIGREISLNGLEESLKKDKMLVLVAQKDESQEIPDQDKLFSVGTLAEIIQVLKLKDQSTKVLIEGLARVKINKVDLIKKRFLIAETTDFFEIEDQEQEVQAFVSLINEQFENYVKMNKKIPTETLMSIISLENNIKLIDQIVSYLSIKTEEKQTILETESVLLRCKQLYEILNRENELLEVEKKIDIKVKDQIDKVQKEYYLKEKLKAIHAELKEEEDSLSPEVMEYKEKLKEVSLSQEAEARFNKELERLKKTSTFSAESGVIKTYLDWLLDLPWLKKTKDNLKISEVAKVLNKEHYGLEKVKERILEYISVFRLTKKVQGSILCFAGPPGVGKTSIAKSIANAMNRNFARISLGGMRDEAEIRGHRKTYVGAMPGRIIQAMQKAGSKNPVVLLDEIDKLASDYRGDPSAALMEILDPEQNKNFSDHYLELAFDLSDTFFICTANSLHNIQGPLLDRMEIIQISGYTDAEKMQIATNYLIPKQLIRNGISSKNIEFSKKSLLILIKQYTMEAGVRNLERVIAKICRKVARIVVENRKTFIKLSKASIKKYLGAPKYLENKMELLDQVGLVMGLAWTELGGSTLPVEAAVVNGKGVLTITGQLGDVMQESAKAALTYIRTKSAYLKLDNDFYKKKDIHVHVPEGAIPKDGPSAGITIATALASALSKKPVKRNFAMTGEITLRGRVLPIGGLKEKALAAFSSGIKNIIIPFENKKDLEEIPQDIRKKIKFFFVKHMDEVIQKVF